MTPSYHPVTIDGSEILPDAPRAQGMDDADAQAVSDAAEEYRQGVLHCHFDLTGRDVTAYAANAPDGPVLFDFGDGSAELSEESTAGQATATHTYAADGVYLLGVRVQNDRWFTEVPVNWPASETASDDDVPEGSIDTVLAWVGDDPGRAQQALDAEQAGQQRTTLITKLEAIVE
jgi:hypothetical protein